MTGRSTGDGEGVVEVAFRAATALGDHVSGSATITLPLDR